ncbi:probable ornithine decarboxylase [Oppia nitens]|uniref:probable ornithine decarboxylase n=1 Tax=Oppia nitens TaxID=1686743 RepID=UPI0023DBE0AD|nr:probable ornithine decarboxylase [Oppia nitens]
MFEYLKSDEPLNIFNVETVIKKHEQWLKLMPRVRPYYAFKCNPFEPLLKLLIDMGCGFDCASQHEIETVLTIGADPGSIVYANPNKTESSIVYSRKMGISLVTVDSEEELIKLERLHPGARLLLRLKVDETGSYYGLGEKFGATLRECRQLLTLCSQLGLRPVGVAFHVGSFCQSTLAYQRAIEMARRVFDISHQMGFPDMTVLDLGGGFPGTDRCYFEQLVTEVATFDTIAQAITRALDLHFPPEPTRGSSNIQIIAEPGTYYAAAAFTLITRIISKRVVSLTDANHNHCNRHIMYYLNDGMFGSFTVDKMIGKQIIPIPVLNSVSSDDDDETVGPTADTIAKQQQSCLSTLWGPTLTSLDCIVCDILMPELDVGDHIVFNDMGAYSHSYSPYGFNDLKSDEPLNIFNVETVIKKHEQWLKLMPRVRPYYAVKCNPFEPLLKLLIAMGCGFDCASQHEIETVLTIGADPGSIVYANPNKTESSIIYSQKMGISLVTVDGEEELLKLERLHPGARLLLRLKVDETGSYYGLGEKFGATLTECRQLLELCRQLDLRPVGVAFHVGAFCQSTLAYQRAIEMARQVFDISHQMGFPDMTVLDLGGGFPGTDRCYFEQLVTEVATFDTIAQTISRALDLHFPPEPSSSSSLQIIAEPGTYYAAAAFTLITRIISKRVATLTDANHNHCNRHIMYYLNDGMFGSFTIAKMIGKHIAPIPVLTMASGDGDGGAKQQHRQSCLSTLWGPTLTSLDCIVRDIQLPELDVGDHIVFNDMGAYSHSYSPYGFNGMPTSRYCIHVSDYADKYQQQHFLLLVIVFT